MEEAEEFSSFIFSQYTAAACWLGVIDEVPPSTTRRKWGFPLLSAAHIIMLQTDVSADISVPVRQICLIPRRSLPAPAAGRLPPLCFRRVGQDQRRPVCGSTLGLGSYLAVSIMFQSATDQSMYIVCD